VENTWRMKFKEIEEKVFQGKRPVEQVVVIADLKGITLKDLSNKQVSLTSSFYQLNVVFQTLLLELQCFYPEMLRALFILNAPMFF